MPAFYSAQSFPKKESAASVAKELNLQSFMCGLVSGAASAAVALACPTLAVGALPAVAVLGVGYLVTSELSYNAAHKIHALPRREIDMTRIPSHNEIQDKAQNSFLAGSAAGLLAVGSWTSGLLQSAANMLPSLVR
jgi:hypothetical protein